MMLIEKFNFGVSMVMYTIFVKLGYALLVRINVPHFSMISV